MYSYHYSTSVTAIQRIEDTLNSKKLQEDEFRCYYEVIDATYNNRRINLSGFSAQNVNFNGVDFSGADLSGFAAVDSSFCGATFSEADLSESIFSNCSFKFANLEKAFLSRTDLSEANLSETIWDGLVFQASSVFNLSPIILYPTRLGWELGYTKRFVLGKEQILQVLYRIINENRNRYYLGGPESAVCSAIFLESLKKTLELYMGFRYDAIEALKQLYSNRRVRFDV